MKKNLPKKAPLKSGFYYWGGAVFEVDSKGVRHERKDITPSYKGIFKRKFK